MTDMCDDLQITALTESIQQGAASSIHVDQLLQSFPNDPRLHFLHGSLLVGEGRHIDAHKAFKKSLILAPDFSIARFQLGFFELTSGEAEQSMQTLAPLDQLPEDHYLRVFAQGLRHLIKDQFESAIMSFRKGIELNDENQPLNNDMKLLVEECMPLAKAQEQQDSSTSETSMILNQFSRSN